MLVFGSKLLLFIYQRCCFAVLNIWLDRDKLLPMEFDWEIFGCLAFKLLVEAQSALNRCVVVQVIECRNCFGLGNGTDDL